MRNETVYEMSERFRERNPTNHISLIADSIGVNVSTVKRWFQKKKIPEEYRGDFNRLLDEPAHAVDIFYTKPEIARQCYIEFMSVADKLDISLENHIFLEPSAGKCAFYDLMPNDRRIGMDIQPITGRGEIINTDFLEWQPTKDRDGEVNDSFVVLGNPPFGLRGHLALQFINHASQFADMVGFIVPQLFKSDGKGVPGKRVDKCMTLAHSMVLRPDSFIDGEGKTLVVPTLFQVWSKYGEEYIKETPRRNVGSYITVYSLSDGGTSATTRNRHMLDKCDIYIPSTSYHGIKTYSSFDELPNRRGYGILIHRDKQEIMKVFMEHDWSKTAFRSTNSALNLRVSLIEDVIADNGFYI